MPNAAATKSLVEAADLTRTDARAESQDAFAATLGREGAALGGVHNGRGRPASDRLRIYRNNVIVSLSEALAVAFPATRRLLGENFFENAAVAYAMAHKPASPLLFEYGATFGDFLARLPGVAPYPFVPEAARIEFARIEATHAADTAPLTPDALATVAPQSLGTLVFTAHPATRLVPTPAGGLAAWQQNQDPPQPAVSAAAALITRPHAALSVAPLSRPAHDFTEALLRGATLGEAVDGTTGGLDLSAALGLLMGAGAFANARAAGT